MDRFPFIKKADIEFSEDPIKMVPRLKQIHKLGDFPSGFGPEDLDAKHQSPGKVKTAEPGPPEGVSMKEWDKILQGKKPKVKAAAGLMSSMLGAIGAVPSMSEQYYMGSMEGTGGDEENMPLELLSMAGPQAAQGAQMAQMANRLANRKGRRFEQKQVAHAADQARVVQGLAAELAQLRMEKKGYKLQGHTDVQGLPIAIENKKGSVRKGTSRDGHKWETKMKAPYGYIKGTKGADGDEVDAFIGPDKKAPNAFVVHQRKPDGTGYDEDKVMLAYPNKAAAKKAFLQHYDDPKFLGPIAKVSTERLKELVASKKRLVKISQVSYRALLDELMEKSAAAPKYHKRLR